MFSPPSWVHHVPSSTDAQRRRARRVLDLDPASRPPAAIGQQIAAFRAITPQGQSSRGHAAPCCRATLPDHNSLPSTGFWKLCRMVYLVNQVHVRDQPEPSVVNVLNEFIYLMQVQPFAKYSDGPCISPALSKPYAEMVRARRGASFRAIESRRVGHPR